MAGFCRGVGQIFASSAQVWRLAQSGGLNGASAAI